MRYIVSSSPSEFNCFLSTASAFLVFLDGFHLTTQFSTCFRVPGNMVVLQAERGLRVREALLKPGALNCGRRLQLAADLANPFFSPTLLVSGGRGGWIRASSFLRRRYRSQSSPTGEVHHHVVDCGWVRWQGRSRARRRLSRGLARTQRRIRPRSRAQHAGAPPRC